MPVESRVRVIYGDTDQMGVVYYANYFRYFELSRAEYLRALGWTYREMEAEGALLPVVEATASYKASAKYDDVLIIKATVTQLRRVSLQFEYEIRREADGTLLVTGKTMHACIGRDGKPTRLPDKVAELLRKAEGPSTGLRTGL